MKIPLPAAAKALSMLAKATDTEGLDISKAINRVSAQKKEPEFQQLRILAPLWQQTRNTYCTNSGTRKNIIRDFALLDLLKRDVLEMVRAVDTDRFGAGWCVGFAAWYVFIGGEEPVGVVVLGGEEPCVWLCVVLEGRRRRRRLGGRPE